MKKEDIPFKELHLLMLPDTGRTLMIDDDLVLVDNIGTSLDTDPMSDFVSATYPFKLTFALTMFCLRGFMRVRLNLKEYTLAENDVLVVLPGSICECLEISADVELVVIGLSDHRLVGGKEAAMSMAMLKFFTSTSLMHISQADMEKYESVSSDACQAGAT